MSGESQTVHPEDSNTYPELGCDCILCEYARWKEAEREQARRVKEWSETS